MLFLDDAYLKECKTVVTKIENNSPLANSLEVNSIIVEAQKKKIRSINDLRKISNKIAGFSTFGFWIFWTLGGSAWFGFSVLTGPLFFVQMAVIIVVFHLSFKMWKNKNLIYPT